MRKFSRLGIALLGLVGATLAPVTMASAASSSALRASSAPSGTVTFALPPGSIPTYIFPFVSGPNSNNIDLFQFTPYLWRPLYWFGYGKTPDINFAQSVGQPPGLLQRRPHRHDYAQPRLPLVGRQAGYQPRRRALDEHLQGREAKLPRLLRLAAFPTTSRR